MAVKRIDPDEAARLVEQGWRYVDVRSVPEFEQGHPSGALNIPLMHFEPGRGMTPNAEFLLVFKGIFAPDDKLIIGCKSGGRSYRAAELAIREGYTNVVDMRGGFGGESDRTGQVTCVGWAARGLPTSTEPDSSQTYDVLRKRTTSGS